MQEREEWTAARELTQVIGIRLPEKMAVAFKKEAAERNVRLNELFRKMWELYQQVKREERTRKASDGNK